MTDKCDMVEPSEMACERQRSRRRRAMTCWYCGHTGHIRRRCFRRMRQRKRQIHDASVTDARQYACDGNVTFESSLPSDYFVSWDSTLSTRFLLDEYTAFHVTPCRDWFSSFSSGRLGCVRLAADGSAYDIHGAGDVCLSLPSGASYMLRHVRYVPRLNQSLISVRKLQDCGCHVLLREQCFQV